MEERQSRLSNMDWKRFRPYLCVRLIPQNSMFSNFCHVLNTSSYYSWITIIVTNKYGSTYETMEYEPVYNSAHSPQYDISEPIIGSINAIQKIVLFKIDGTLVFDGIPTEFANDCVSPGIYLKRIIFNNGTSQTFKIVIQ